MKSYKSLIALAATFAGTAQILVADGGISGQVTTFESSAPLSDAKVVVDSLGLKTVTDAAGYFSIDGLPAGQYDVEVSYIGLGRETLSVSVSDDRVASLNFSIGEEAIELDTLVVNGQKLGQAKAINAQRNDNGITELVASDAFGNFPDENAAEVLKRVAGISIENDQGEGRYVVIRGIDPDLNNIALDGVTLPSPEGDTNKVALDVIPYEVLERLEIRKTYSPDMDGDAIGGSINLKTISPFDRGGDYGSIKAQWLHNNLVGSNTFGGSFSYGDVFGADNNMGFMISGAYQERELGSNNVEIDGGWVTTLGQDGSSGLAPEEIEFREYEVTRERKSVAANFEKRYGDSNLFYARVSYNYFGDQEFRHRSTIKIDDAIEDEDIADTGFLSVSPTGGTIGGFDAIERDLKDRFEEQEIVVFSIGGETRANDWKFKYKLSSSTSEENEPNRINVDYAFEGGDVEIAYDFSDRYRPVVTQNSGASIFDAANYAFDKTEFENNLTEEERTTVKFDAERDFTWGDNKGTFSFGAKYRTKEKTRDNRLDEYDGSLATHNLVDVLDTTSEYPFFTGGGTYLRTDPQQVRAIMFAVPSGDLEPNVEDTNVADYNSEEDVLALYAMSELQVDAWTFVGGVRFEDTDFTTTGAEYDDDTETVGLPQTFEKSYSNFMPALNGRYEIDENTIFRFSVSQTIARPKIGEASFTSKREDDEKEQGNPELDPYEATNLDLSIERYLASVGRVSASVFYKDIDSFIFEAERPIDGFDVTRPENGEGGSILGLELSWVQDLGQYSDALKGFGIQSNVTLTDSEADIFDDGSLTEFRETPFFKQSDFIANLALTYENERFFFRIAGVQRSEYLDEIGGSAADDRYADDNFSLDVKFRYNVNPHLSIFLEGTNINEEPAVYYFGTPDRLSQYDEFSWSSKMGVSWSM